MENYLWLIVVAGGALLLGGAIAYGSFSQSRNRSVAPAVVLVCVAAIGLAVGAFVMRTPTAPIQPPDPQGTHYDQPAAPSRENALPGTATPTDNR